MIWAWLPLVAFVIGGFTTYFYIRWMKKKDLKPIWQYKYEDGELVGISIQVGTFLDKEWGLLNYRQFPKSSGGYGEVASLQTYAGLLMITAERQTEISWKITGIEWRSVTVSEILTERSIELGRNSGLIERAKNILQKAHAHFEIAKKSINERFTKN